MIYYNRLFLLKRADKAYIKGNPGSIYPHFLCFKHLEEHNPHEDI